MAGPKSKNQSHVRWHRELRLTASYEALLLFAVLIYPGPTLAQSSGTHSGPSAGERTPVINTRYGQVQGIYRTVGDGDRVATYLGIPYATAPVNKNRLSPTRATQQWQRVLQADSYGPSCPQNPPKRFTHLLRHQSEDCLFVNVFVPGE